MATVIRKRKNAPASRPSRSANPIELPDGMRDRIAAKAYELWNERGCRQGRDLEDWLDAETIVMEEIHEARE
ncbi:MAG: DUF2934 domain-containing protein [Nitrospira sp.]|jgi:hypothetical protein|nr:MAG: DUF2934 domain-containing protein [Nitrospira sp. CG24D]TKB83621.1 MAG: DUF2934 domain-containing protein [Nitrospira sp.]